MPSTDPALLEKPFEYISKKPVTLSTSAVTPGMFALLIDVLSAVKVVPDNVTVVPLIVIACPFVKMLPVPDTVPVIVA